MFQKAPESKRTIMMVVFQLYYVVTCSNLNYKDFCNLNHILLVCKTFYKYLSGKMIGGFIVLVNR